MHAFSQTISIELFDCISCALMAAAAACRGRSFGAPLMGAVIIGWLAGLSGPLAREVLMHGEDGAMLMLHSLPFPALCGAMGGAMAALAVKKHAAKLFLLLDSLSITLAAAFGMSLALPFTGIGGALCISLANSLLPGAIRDVALGDTAMFVEKNWYAASAVFASIFAAIFIILPAIYTLPDIFMRATGEMATILGCLPAFALRLWKAGNSEEYY